MFQTSAIEQCLQKIDTKLMMQLSSLKHYNFELTNKKTTINYRTNNIANLMSIIYKKKLSDLQTLSQSIHTLSPLATLSRGYSITLNKDTRQLLTNTQQVDVGMIIETQLNFGTISSKVLNLNPDMENTFIAQSLDTPSKT